MRNTDIKNVIFSNNNATALYWGGSLIWKKESGNIGHDYLSGKFTDNITNLSNYIKINDVITEIPYNESSKEFNLKVENLQSYDAYNVTSGAAIYIERIDSFPDVSAMTDLSYLFRSHTNMTSINLKNMNTSNVESFYYTFQYCRNLTELDLSDWDVSKATNLNGMFGYCSKLETIKINFNLESITNMSTLFISCENLKNVYGRVYNINYNIDCSDAPLTNDSALVFINGLNEVSGVKGIIFSTTTYETLSQEQIATATSKGWSIIKR